MAFFNAAVGVLMMGSISTTCFAAGNDTAAASATETIAESPLRFRSGI